MWVDFDFDSPAEKLTKILFCDLSKILRISVTADYNRIITV